VYTITFYSFKGGVGRTLALVNVGAQLARMGRKVLLVDFDLEAPGLETFERLRPPEPHPGLVEYVTEYVRTKHSPDVRDYIYSPAVSKITGKLWVMPAGRRDTDYQAALTRINWKRLYDDCEGYLFFEDTKAQWEQEFKPDYVLIDSRTGHTDVKGICTRQLPDAVVVLFFPNEQNLVGLKAVCQEIRSEREHGLKKTIGLHFVMSNVPDLDDEDKVLRRRRQAFEKELDIRKLSAVIHRYESVMLFNQAIFVLDRPRSRLAREYRHLTWMLMRHNPGDREGALQFLRRAADTSDNCLWNDDLKMAGQGLPAGHDLLDKIIEHHLDDADLIYEVANSECGGEMMEGAKKIALLDRVLTLKPDHPNARYDRALFKRRRGDVTSAVTDLLQVWRDHGLKGPTGWQAFQELRTVAREQLLEAGAVTSLFQYLRDQGLEGPHSLSALWELREIAPERLLEAVDCAIAQGIGLEDKYKLAHFLAETDAFLSRAIEFMRNYLADETDAARKATATFLLQSYLIRAQRWNEVLNLFDGNMADLFPKALSWAVPFNTAMAHWAQSSNVPEGIAEDIGQRLEQGEAWAARLGQYEPWVGVPEGKSWLLWWRGDNQNAIYDLACWIKKTEEWNNDPDSLTYGYSWWSFWRYRGVRFSEYRDDCQQLLRMILGEPIRPPFLGDAVEAK
jgi:MinD-like ATPase involved in chromosome partitioning or flagellar assembly